MSTEALLEADFKTWPYRHQLKEFEEHAEAEARAMLWHMRTGKTKAVIDRVCHLNREGKVNALVIFAPNGVHENWLVREMPEHAWPGCPYSGLIWRSREVGAKASQDAQKQWAADFKKALKAPGLFVFAINSESAARPDVKKWLNLLLKHRDAVFAVWDESDDYGAPGAKRTRMARGFAKRCRYRTILSGTVAHANPLVVFSQYELLEPGALGFKTYRPFKDFFATYALEETKNGRRFPRLVEYKNLDILRERMAKFSSVVLRKDCEDLPPIIPLEVQIKPSRQQMEAYRQLHRTFILQIEDETISINEKAQRFQKLQQIFSGFIVDENGEERRIPGPNPRLEALSNEVYLAPGKIIIWCQFHFDMDAVEKRLTLDGHKIVSYHGRVSGKQRMNALQAFRTDKSIKALVGHCKSGGRGLDMSAADSIFWYTHTFSGRFRSQAIERASKIGGGNVRSVDFIAPGPDEHILETTNGRIEMADYIAGVGMKSLLERVTL